MEKKWFFFVKKNIFQSMYHGFNKPAFAIPVNHQGWEFYLGKSIDLYIVVF